MHTCGSSKEDCNILLVSTSHTALLRSHRSDVLRRSPIEESLKGVINYNINRQVFRESDLFSKYKYKQPYFAKIDLICFNVEINFVLLEGESGAFHQYSYI